MKKSIVFAFFLISIISEATHLRCGYIGVEVLNSTSRTCKITITVFTDASSVVLFGGSQDILDFGDGTYILVPETANIPRPDLGENVGVASYSIVHQYSGPGSYTVRYTEPNRNGGIINMDNSITTLFSIETRFVFDPSFGNFQTPQFLVDPFFTATLGSDLSLSAGAYSEEEDFVLRYEVTTPSFAMNYKLPENFSINPFNGVITWDTKFLDQYLAGEYLFAVKVHLYKVVDESMYYMCTVVRDFQIVLVDDGDGGKISPNLELDENNRVYVSENEFIQIKTFYEVNTPTGLAAYSDLTENESAFSFTTYDSSTNENIKVGVLTLTNHPSIIRDTPYQITIRGRDDDFGSDINYLFYTKDLHPEVITSLNHEELTIHVFPNPVKDFLMVALPENITADINILDCFGKAMSMCKGAGTITVNVQDYPAGLYFCHVRTGSTYKTVKFIKP